MTQQELARRINEKTSVIQDYESGKAIPSPQILAKIERVLGIKLRGKTKPHLSKLAALNVKPNR